ncbi:MAG TPA: alpha/beta hydrolase fold domain-containing protein [Mycobacterium sp.]|jgi:acetyl esterase|nr:alpha/beta hydrolase fold domain-containing protein [Mycobacterium sp.]
MPNGRLANPDCSLGTDPRADPRMIEAFAPFGIDALLPELPVTVDSPLDDRLAFSAETEEMISTVFEAFGQAVPIAEGVTTTTVTIPGGDGQDLTLYVSRPDTAVALPCVVHLHGGGMAILSAADTAIMRGCESLAATGLVVVGVEFRNSSGKLGVHPFPAGLNDCAAAVRWVFANRERLGITHLIVSGESGGGNLTLAVMHKAKREGWLHEIAGAYAQCPYISNRWQEPPDEFPSMRENDGYFISLQQLAVMASIYDPECTHSDDPTCWAGVAADEDLSGMPPHVISVNELDPLRDEGLDYYRRLARAGVAAIGRVVAGTCHGGDMLLGGAMPDVFAASVRDVSGFAKSLA